MAENGEKANKRKRNTDGSSNPHKRVAIEGDPKIKISVHPTEKWAPVVASSRGLAMPSSMPLKPFTQRRKQIPSGPGKTPISTTELLLHSSEHHKLNYTGREEASGGSDAILKHYVGIYDPETGKLEVMEARKMLIRGVVRDHQAPVEDLDPLQRNFERRNNLGEAFGTKKAKKAIASRTENAIAPQRGGEITPPKIDSAAKAMLQNIAKETAGMATREQLAEAVDANKPRPKANLDATKIQDVYPVDSLIGDDILVHVPVKTWVDAIKAKEAINTTSRFIAHRLAMAGPNVQKLKILRYMYMVIRVLDKSEKKRSETFLPKRSDVKALIEDMPESVWEYFRRKFSSQGKMTKLQVDLIITHLCALACIVDNYEVDIWDLQEDLKLESKGMQQYFQEIGAKIAPLGVAAARTMDKASAAQHKLAKLKLPLTFPKVNFGRAKK
ncbi:RNA polymerase I associated factor, A49-like protein [Amylocarpus encephaloides]|uniref:RNA polymerase I associated factor, A49-like protein n=1 Tax=Amylocarpus encephaloides TaxID=45428 RepID=A0A9P7YG99_9HELO|nr:RNA polymerase I associated factor, A49-like protein [Amylocarpus encephaloides]